MVTYGRLGGKIVPAVPKLSSIHHELNDDTRIALGHGIDLWVETASTEKFTGQKFESAVSNMRWRYPDHVPVFFRIRGSQMRLSLYKSTLYTPSKISKYPYFAQLAVQYAIHNIRTLSQFKVKSEEAYQCHASHCKHFLVSSLVPLCLAIRNAPQQFSCNSVEYLAGIHLLKCSSVSPLASTNLSKTVLALESALSGWKLAPSNIPRNKLQFQWSSTSSLATGSKNPNSETSSVIEDREINGRPQGNPPPSTPPLSILSPAATTSHPQLILGHEDWMNTVPEQISNEQDMFQELANYDFSMDCLWNPTPENFLYGQATVDTETDGFM
jgi:hypothetical protein